MHPEGMGDGPHSPGKPTSAAPVHFRSPSPLGLLISTPIAIWSPRKFQFVQSPEVLVCGP